MGYAHEPRTITITKEPKKPTQAVKMPWCYTVLSVIIDVALAIGLLGILIGLFVTIHEHCVSPALISSITTAVGALGMKAFLCLWNAVERIAAYTQQMAEKQS